MSANSEIAWTDHTWPVIRGCSKVSPGCKNCWAIRDAHLHAGNKNPKMQRHFGGLTVLENGRPNWTGVVRLDESILDWPLRWKKPARIFAASSGDLFHEALTDEAIDRVFAVMALCPLHRFQVLTKRAQRMREYFSHPHRVSFVTLRAANLASENFDRYEQLTRAPWQWPLPNVWLGVSVEDQATADERIPLLLQTPAAIRFISYEPALAPVDFSRWLVQDDGDGHCTRCGLELEKESETIHPHECPPGFGPSLDWVIVGGESGPGARPFDIEWARETIRQFKAAGVPVFVKQLGANPVEGCDLLDDYYLNFDSKGGNWETWPADIQVREFPR